MKEISGKEKENDQNAQSDFQISQTGGDQSQYGGYSMRCTVGGEQKQDSKGEVSLGQSQMSMQTNIDTNKMGTNANFSQFDSKTPGEAQHSGEFDITLKAEIKEQIRINKEAEHERMADHTNRLLE